MNQAHQFIANFQGPRYPSFFSALDTGRSADRQLADPEQVRAKDMKTGLVRHIGCRVTVHRVLPVCHCTLGILRPLPNARQMKDHVHCGSFLDNTVRGEVSRRSRSRRGIGGACTDLGY